MSKFRKEDALDYHSQGRPGKIEVIPTKPYSTQRDLSLAYSPGVAEPCLSIQKNPDEVYKYTAKGNLVAVISNGTAVLGLGNIGPEASKPVMEGKGLLFKIFADIDVFDIAQLIKDVYISLEIQASKKNIKLELAKKYEKPILVNADKYRIRQVLVNLITNSIKYGKENGKTITEFNYLNDDVLVEIKDNGDGIEASHLPRLFERFYRVDKGRSREQGGTGLGLSIVKHIIDAHNKSIVVESEIGKGTKFIFSLTAA